MVFGECGAGKSHLLNRLMEEYSDLYDYDIEEDMVFESASRGTSVTKNVSSKRIGNLVLYDSPGTNDLSNGLTDPEI